MKRWVFNVLLIFFVLVFLVSGYFLVDYILASRKQKESFNNLASIMAQATVPTQPVQTLPPSDTDAPAQEMPTISLDEEALVSPYVEITDPETGEIVSLLPEFAPLYSLNNDIVGWISIADTVINYPVMQTPDSPNYYLRRDYYGKHSTHGCIYIREDADVFAPSDNLTIYGHRMRDGSMFYDILKYKKKSFWEEHQYITFNTLRERHTYQIFAAFKTTSTIHAAFPYHMFVDAADPEEFDEYVENCLDISLYDTGIVPVYGDKLITLSTCDYSQENGRLVVVAVRMD